MDPVKLLVACRLLQTARARVRPASPAELARRLDPKFVVTPTIRLISDIAVRSVTQRDQKDVVSAPPRTGKSEALAIWLPVWALMCDPDLQIMIISNGDDLAKKHSRRVRDIITEHSDFLGFRIAPDKTAAGQWNVQGHRGAMLAAGISSHVVGFGADLMILDDLVGSAAEADSEAHRKRILAEYQGSLAARVHPGGSTLQVMCMTGDTPVLMANGDEKPLRDIRVGDEVATYENGQITTSTVQNWANQGADSIYSIRMKSGRVVRANARHPFLTVENGREVWQQTAGLTKGSVILTATGVSGATQSAPPTVAIAPQSAKGCAHLTTTRSDGRMATDPHQLQQKSAEKRGYATDMESKKPNTRHCSKRSRDCVPSVEIPRQAETRGRTGMESSASTTITSPAGCVVYSATTATSLLDTASRPRSCAPPLTTYSVARDEVAEVVPCGVEEVFDVQIDRTENFIANGLVSHNTRWHEEDIAGSLLKLEPDQWRATNITAVGERGIPDALGKAPGVAMVSALGFTPDDYARRRRTVGDRMWYAQYMGKPSNPAGSLIKSAWIAQHRLAAAPRSPIYTVVGVDPADSGKGDECGIIATTLFGVGRVAMIADKSGRMTSDQWALAAVDLAIEVGASEIGVEGFAARETYTRVVREAIRRRQDEGKLHRDIIVTGWPPKGSGRGGGDAIARAAPLRQDLETGRLVLAGQFPTFEEQVVAWQAGQHQPDRLSALIVGHDLCVHSAGLEWGMSSPADLAGASSGVARTAGSAAVTDIQDWMRLKLA